MIICEVLDISPYELLQGTENKKHKEYVSADYVLIDKDSKEYQLIEAYQNMNHDARSRLEGYLEALKDMKYRVTYKVSEHGNYTIHCLLNGRDIRGSPWDQQC